MAAWRHLRSLVADVPVGLKTSISMGQMGNRMGMASVASARDNAAAAAGARLAKPRTGTAPELLVSEGKCLMCGHLDKIDHKNVRLLNQFVSKSSGMILSRSTTGVCAKAQRRLAKAIKRARQFGTMPYVNSLPRYSKDPIVNKFYV